MIPAQFDYMAPATLDEAVCVLAEHPDGAKVLAGGHSLIPAMKLRLAQPQLLVDIARIKSLAYIREEGDQILIGATDDALSARIVRSAATDLSHCCPSARRASAMSRCATRERSAAASRIRIRRATGPRRSSPSTRRWS